MNRILGIVALGAILTAGMCLSENVSRFDAERPTLKTPALEPLAEHLSRATIPISVPIAALEEALERRTPKRKAGSLKDGLGAAFARSELSWDLKRSDLQVSGRSGELNIATKLSGEARAAGTLWLLRKIDFDSHGDVLASASLTAHPTLEPNWRISANLSETRIEIQRANIPIRQIGDLDVREQIFPGIRITAKGLRTQLNRSVARSDFFRQAAKKGWRRLCGSTPLGADSELWLETKPVVARAAQVRIGHKNIHTVIGIEVKTRILTEQTHPECPFPKTLLVEKPKAGGFEVVMPAVIDYKTLKRTLAKEVVGKSLGKHVSVIIKEINIRPYAQRLLLETTVAVETPLPSGTETRGTLYVLAEPELNAKSQTITLKDVALETDSQNVLLSMAGKAAEPLLIDTLSKLLPLDLGPELDELRERAGETLSALSSENISVSWKFRQIRLTRLDVGPEYLRLMLTAQGRLAATVRAIP